MRPVSAERDAKYVGRKRPQFIENSLNWLKVADPFAGPREALLCAVAHGAGG